MMSLASNYKIEGKKRTPAKTISYFPSEMHSPSSAGFKPKY